MRSKPIVYHIPVCPFSQRLKILLTLKGIPDAVDFEVVDITVPRSAELLAKTRGISALPIIETEDGAIINESLVILRYLEQRFAPRIGRDDPLEHAIENMLIAKEGPFTTQGYLYVMNRDPNACDTFRDKLLSLYKDINDFLQHYASDGPFLFDDFGLAEAVFTPVFMRFWFLDYYEGFALPDTADFARVREWRAACLAHPAAQQVTEEEIIKLYYDYAMGAGNGALVEGRQVSSFTFTPDWPGRPMPPRDKWVPATDAQLGLI
ncbi:glutathione S-transferase family protein [Actibacterium pelagium]|uniref:Glutathione S-transferase n=1 Tax=Actibacterium pelagium TaxID=2029103 RepID=A0A917AAW4_9RHOB|nr:glutathione S-transferase family protein [Actibacterium pelagium]GGE37418.1 hypothetical protein GCM10011517_01450 [Actibacterium pelagium]